MLKPLVIHACLVACVAALCASDVHAAYLYRFTNAQGKVEISNAIPNDRVVHGYDVLDMNGRVVRRVAPELSEEELAAKREAEAAREACEDAKRRVMALYRYETEIDHAKAKALDALAIAIDNDEANLAHVRGQHSELLEQAARMERSGNTLTSVVIQNIERAEAQVRVLEESIKNRSGERGEIEKRFEEERAVFLQGGCN